MVSACPFGYLAFLPCFKVFDVNFRPVNAFKDVFTEPDDCSFGPGNAGGFIFGACSSYGGWTNNGS